MSREYFLTIKRNQIKMIRNRGYNVEHEEWILDEELTGEQFESRLLEKKNMGDGSLRSMLYGKYQHATKKIRDLFVEYVGLSGGKQIKVEAITNFTRRIDNKNKDGVLIVNSLLSPKAAEHLAIITEASYQVFQEDDLLWDFIEHVFIPSHKLIPHEEAKKLKKELGLNNRGLLTLFTTDQVVKYFNWPIDSLVEITYDNNSMLSGTSKDYGLVC